LRNGLTPAEISAVVTHCAVYCGIPAAVDAMRVVDEIVHEATRS
jgi:alkylhydroperoxidase/carboxymuconolactone decarboxylase family protein YurZ